LFSRSAQAEAEGKSFGVSKATAIRIHEALQHKVEQTLQASGLPVIRSTEATQRGDTFGYRLANAVNDCWKKGYEQLIIVGGDTPELSASDIDRAQVALEAGRPTIGKDFRGGSFLIGLTKHSFRQNQFAELPWQTKQISCALKAELGLACAHVATDVFELEARSDCNSKQDLCCLAKRTCNTLWSRLLHTSTCHIVDFDHRQELVSRFGESSTSRGPPHLLQLAA